MNSPSSENSSGVRPLYRIIDANLNRLKEGIRVVEDICRFYFDDREIAKKLKELRHSATISEYRPLLENRDILNDVLKSSYEFENSKKEIRDIVIANFKRTQEASRVLEEIYKLIDIRNSEKFKKIRYSLYNLEKEILVRLF
ncbi:MAG TPA: thiamine-phosphate pyrophosphorylase [Campylobacterales bacterium]|nr:thiamine-phosphate pyrophosphorylase [Campylobacterales bacterium]HIO71408.1 thiamine-phosphate pyrophosphorylase [Campylobacterales bacterium]